MKPIAFVIALGGVTAMLTGTSHAGPSTIHVNQTAARNTQLNFAASSSAVKKNLPQSIRKLGFKGGGGPSRVQGHCTFGNDNISHCEDCEVDWDDLTMVCIANMICYDNNGKKIACPQS